jgi:hypothetical protein
MNPAQFNGIIQKHFKACAHWNGQDGSCNYGAGCGLAASHVAGTASEAFAVAKQCALWDGQEGSCPRGPRCRFAPTHVPGEATRAFEVVFGALPKLRPLDPRPPVNLALNALLDSGRVPEGQQYSERCLSILRDADPRAIQAAVAGIMRPHKANIRDVNAVLVAELKAEDKRMRGGPPPRR